MDEKRLAESLEERVEEKRPSFEPKNEGFEIEMFKTNLILTRIYSNFYKDAGNQGYYDLADIKLKNASTELRNYYKSSMKEIYGNIGYGEVSSEKVEGEEELKKEILFYRQRLFDVMRDYDVGSDELKEALKGYPKF